MDTFILIGITGIGLGALYFLVASGLSLIYGLMGVLNFAHGSFLSVGAFVGYWVATQLGPDVNMPDFILAMIVGGLAAGDGEQVLLDLEGQFVRLEARDGDLDAIGVLARRLDIVGRPAGLLTGPRGGLQQIGQAVETDGGTVQRGEIIGTHQHPPEDQQG